MDRLEQVKIAYKAIEKAKDILPLVKELHEILLLLDKSDLSIATYFPTSMSGRDLEAIIEKLDIVKKFESEQAQPTQRKIGDLVKSLVKINTETGFPKPNDKEMYSGNDYRIIDVQESYYILFGGYRDGRVIAPKETFDQCFVYLNKDNEFKYKTLNLEGETTYEIIEHINGITYAEFTLYSLNPSCTYFKNEFNLINVIVDGKTYTSIVAEANNNEIYGGYVKAYFAQRFNKEDIEIIQFISSTFSDGNKFVGFKKQENGTFKFQQDLSKGVPRDLIQGRKPDAIADVMSVEIRH